jgi:perosamine synthetase
MIKHNKVNLDKNLVNSVNWCLKSGNIATQFYVSKLENFIAKEYYKSGYCAAVSSGSSALYLAILSLTKKKKPRILIPTYSCSALLNAIYLANAEPVIADIDKNNLTIDLSKKYQNIDIVIAVNIFGSNPDLKKIKKIYNSSKIILDACHSLGRKILKNDSVYLYCDIVIHSLYATKIICAGHGGLIWSLKKKYVKFCKDYINFDNVSKYKKRFNFLLTDIQASLALAQLKNVEQNRKFRKGLFIKYKKNLAYKAHFFDKYSKNDIIYRSVICFKTKKDRNFYKSELRKKKIETIIPITNEELLHNYLKLNKKNFLNSELVSQRTLSIPFYHSLNKKNIFYINKVLGEVR